MTTVRDLVTDSLSELGVVAEGETPSAALASLSLRTMNRLIDSWSLERLQIYTVTRTLIPVQANNGEYLLGEGLGATYEDGFDTAWVTEPTGWGIGTSGDGAATNDTTVYQAGGHAVKMVVTASGTVVMSQDFLMVSGSEVTLSLYVRASFSSAGFVTVQNLDTGNYLTSAGAWQAAQADVFTASAGGSFVAKTITFDMESAATIGAASTTLRVICRQADVTASVWFDTFSLTSSNSVQMPRPASIDHVNLVDTAQSPDLETPLSPLTDDMWAGISQKAITATYPTHWYYNPTYPFGTLQLWPTPTGSDLSVAVYAPEQVQAFVTLDDTLTLPPGYERMIVKNLALELCPALEKQPSPLLVRQAADSLASVKRANRRDSDLSLEASALIGSRPYFDFRTGR